MDKYDTPGTKSGNPLQRLWKKFRSWKKPVQVLVVLLLVLLPAVCYGAWYYYRITRPAHLFTDPPLPTPLEEEKPPEVDWDVDNYFSKNIVNIVLLGFDGSEARDEVYSVYRTDTIKVVSFNFDEEKVHIIDIPRDSYTRIATTPTYDKVNHAYYFGYKYGDGDDHHASGLNYTLTSVSNILGGLPFTYYASVDMDAVVEMVDAIGGVKFDVPFDVYDTKGKLRMAKGEQTLQGKNYLWYLRTRAVGGDIGRVNRQTDLLLATLDHLRNQGLIKNIPTLYNTYQELIDTNLSNQQIISLAMFIGKLGRGAIQQHTLQGGGQSRDGIYYMVLDRNITSTVMQEVFGIDHLPPLQAQLTDTKPKAPKNFAAGVTGAAGKQSISLSWQAGDSHTQAYHLYRSVNGRAEKLISSKQEGKSYTDQDVAPGNAYRYRLEAINHRAISDSVAVSINIEALVPPEKPEVPEVPEKPEVPVEPEEPEEPEAPEEPPTPPADPELPLDPPPADPQPPAATG
ncbi:MAG TPA: LCP family protein [Oscillospiraceae bacterium]|nr:LCP family protein [Oscillospiraceae bacterium]